MQIKVSLWTTLLRRFVFVKDISECIRSTDVDALIPFKPRGKVSPFTDQPRQVCKKADEDV